MPILASKDTPILIQGISGREAVSFTRDMLDYGSNVVAGVTPGKGGIEIHGVRVYDSVSRACRDFKLEVSVVSVPAPAVKSAAIESIENGIRLIVIITERVRRKDVVETIQLARQKGAMVIGPNSLGLISPDVVKIGMAGGPVKDAKKAYMKGPVGIISRSGGMTTEIANMLTMRGIGQSTCISIGGDEVVGSNFVDLIKLFESDTQTKAVCIFCEPGGVMEQMLAEYVIEQGCRLPIFAFVAGKFVDEMPGQRFGHAGAIIRGIRKNRKQNLKVQRGGNRSCGKIG
jgi:succinyl-CoA synthetase alpha subunit